MNACDNSKNFEDVLKKDKTLLKKITKQELKQILEIDKINSKIDWIFKNKVK